MSETSSAKIRLIAVQLVYYGNNTIALPGHAFEISQDEAAFLLERGAATPVGDHLPAYFDNEEPVYILSDQELAQLKARVPPPVPPESAPIPAGGNRARKFP